MHEIHWYEILGALLFLCVVIRYATWLTLGWLAWACYHAWLDNAPPQTYGGYLALAFVIICFAANIRGGDLSSSTADADSKRIQDDYHRRQRESYFR